MLWGAARFFCVGSGASTMKRLRQANAKQPQWAFGLMDLAADPLPQADMLLSRRISEVAEPQAALSRWHCSHSMLTHEGTLATAEIVKCCPEEALCLAG